ncbi:MAG: hypothetical protein K2Y13_12670 [Burkholderiaceae bacterium]|uniref:Uncharacterized protein n=1 Tax=Herminiimonas contaminans TaxID=1111140 RepID=A0ABS0EVB7_9BURK|nr:MULTISPECIES: hypothetical protein [Oxalobacteraceae]MBF8178792.1 hypothetical protein [Herminiimonas contaminans]MBX9800304.1 hypothetical protein [Burkholderiaceae bacterium]
MNNSVFVEIQFFMLIACTFVLPIGIYSYMMWKRSISRKVVLLFGVLLIAVSGGNIFLLHLLRILARDTPSLLDDSIFASEMSVALYLIPAIFAGIGVNIISHILISHLAEAEKKFDKEHKERR